MSAADEIAKLDKLRQQGLLSDGEFEAQKRQLLQQSAFAPPAAQGNASASGSGSGMPDRPADHEAIRAEVKRLNMWSLGLGVPGLVIQLFGHSTNKSVLTLIGTALFVSGLAMYARMRGRHPALGLLGLLSCLGTVILYLLEKRCLGCHTANPRVATACTQCGAPLGS